MTDMEQMDLFGNPLTDDRAKPHKDLAGNPVTEEQLKEHLAAERWQTNRHHEIRTFETGATRDTDRNKLDYEGFLSPAVLRRYAEYMHEHRKQSDGVLRASDNWQKGIPKDEYMKSMARHFMEFWAAHRGDKGDKQETLCALLFNVMGYLHEELKNE